MAPPVRDTVDASAASGHAAESLQHVASLVLSLATGRPRVDASSPWTAIERLAIRECCGPLIWHRAGVAIRRYAPRAVVESLRSHAVTTEWRLRRRLDVVRGVLELLASVGVDAVVHKGMPLSKLLYDDAFVRPSVDIDLFVRAADRGATRRALLTAGWEWVEGAEPWEEAFVRVHEGHAERLEIHTFVLGDLLAHLPVPALRTQRVDIEGVSVQMPTPVSLAVTLATHLSQHRALPLLFAVDFATLWSKLDSREREDARTLARACRAERYVAFASALAGLREGEPGAEERVLSRLGFRERRGYMGHPAWRDLRFASGNADRARIALGWLLPPRIRGARDGVMRAQLARLRRLVGGRPGSPVARPLATSEPAARSLRATPADLVALVRDALRAAPAIWVEARGTSMMPAIPTGASVRLARPGAGEPRRGAVVLADLGRGGVVLHRVVERRGDVLTLRGDNCAQPDMPTSLASVVAVADRLRVGARDYPVPPRTLLARAVNGLRAARAALERRRRRAA